MTDCGSVDGRTKTPSHPVLFQMGGVTSQAPEKQDGPRCRATFLIQASQADVEGARWSSLALAADLSLFGQGQSLTVFSMTFLLKAVPEDTRSGTVRLCRMKSYLTRKSPPEGALINCLRCSWLLDLAILGSFLCCFYNKWVISVIACLLFSSQVVAQRVLLWKIISVTVSG